MSQLTMAQEPLPDHVSQHVETIATLQSRAEKNVGFHQRTVETVTAFLGRPLFLNLILILVAFWVLANLFPRSLGTHRFDPPPFNWLQDIVSLGSLLMTTVVLITQNRQSRIAERRSQLDLQVNLLAEQKIAKLIALVEELRRDMPTVQNRHDPEAEAMKQSTDPQAVLEALEDKLEETTDAVEDKKAETAKA